MSHGCTKTNAQEQEQTAHQDLKATEALISTFCGATGIPESSVLNIPCLASSERLRAMSSGGIGAVVIPLPNDITTPLSCVQLTQEQNGQLLLDNNEVLLTLTNNAYSIVLVSGEVTIVENDSLHRDLDTSNDKAPIESGDSDLKVTNIPASILEPTLSDDIDLSFELSTDSDIVTSDTELTEMLLGALL